MRRYLVIFTCLVFCLSLFCFSAFASEIQPFAHGDFLNGQQSYMSVSEYQSPLYCVLNLDGENNPSFSGWVDIPQDFGDFTSYELPNVPYTLSFFFDDSTNDLMISIEDSEGSYWDGPGTVYFYLTDPNAPVDPETSESFPDMVGQFFTWAVTSLTAVLAVIINSPPLIILCIAFPIVGFAVALLSRLKNL